MLALLVASLTPYALVSGAATEDDMKIAQSLAGLLRDARTIISDKQDLINDPRVGDKHLTGEVVLDQALAKYSKDTGTDPRKIDPASRQGRLLRAMMAAIAEVVEDNQSTINEKGTGFKGFVPATFTRLTDEAFVRLAKGEAEIKFTAPLELVRNRKARPDPLETEVIEKRFLDPAWPAGQPFSAEVETKGRPAFRVMIPEHYVESCLACHGSPKGETDITGYPKEGAKLNDLGGVVSITLYH
jgi:hypothetical protein